MRRSSPAGRRASASRQAVAAAAVSCSPFAASGPACRTRAASARAQAEQDGRAAGRRHRQGQTLPVHRDRFGEQLWVLVTAVH